MQENNNLSKQERLFFIAFVSTKEKKKRIDMKKYMNGMLQKTVEKKEWVC